MKITARLNGENQSLVDTLTQRGITAKLVKRGVVIDLPRRGRMWSAAEPWDNQEYEIPPEAQEAAFFIDVPEEGGGKTHTGKGTVVCGLSGKALRPYYVPHGGHLACGTHAYFSVPVAVITVTGYCLSDDIVIKKHEIVRNGDSAQIKSSTLWKGDLEVMPESFSRFQAAALAARDKANCYHCRHVHFGVNIS